jgi:hypothetical protein
LVDHRAIAEAIEARDRRGARAAMRRVLDRSIWVATLTQLSAASAKRGTRPRPPEAEFPSPHFDCTGQHADDRND